MRRLVLCLAAAALLAAFALADAGGLFSAAPGLHRDSVAAATAARLPDGLDLSDRDVDIFRLGYAMGYDAALYPPEDGAPQDYVLNVNSKKFHRSTCASVDKMDPVNRRDFHGTRDDAISMGYVPCKNCNP